MDQINFPVLIVLIVVIMIGGLFYHQKAKTKKRDVGERVGTEISIMITDDARRAKVYQALSMILKTEYGDYVREHISVVKEGTRTRIWRHEKPATFEITYKYIDMSSVQWLASVFVHEALHVEQTHTNGYKDQQSEIEANELQRRVLISLGGRQADINHLASADGLHFDSNGNGVLDHDDKWDY